MHRSIESGDSQSHPGCLSFRAESRMERAGRATWTAKPQGKRRVSRETNESNLLLFLYFNERCLDFARHDKNEDESRILIRSNLMKVADLPAINASLNLLSTIFIATGWYLIRRGHWRRHVACMITAVISSSFFLAGYIDLSRARRGKILRLYRAHGVDLFSDVDLTHPARLRHTPARHYDARSRFPAPLGPASTNRALDDADLALRVGHRRACLPHALQMVPAAFSVMQAILPAGIEAKTGLSASRRLLHLQRI